MKIKYIIKITFCCRKMEEAMNFHHIISCDKDEVKFNLSLRNPNFPFIESRINYCPFCGEKVEMFSIS